MEMSRSIRQSPSPRTIARLSSIPAAQPARRSHHYGDGKPPDYRSLGQCPGRYHQPVHHHGGYDVCAQRPQFASSQWRDQCSGHDCHHAIHEHSHECGTIQALSCLAERRAGFGHDRSRQQWTEHRIHAQFRFHCRRSDSSLLKFDAQDVYGNNFSNFAETFTIAGALASTAPVAQVVNPFPNATNVPLNTVSRWSSTSHCKPALLLAMGVLVR